MMSNGRASSGATSHEPGSSERRRPDLRWSGRDWTRTEKWLFLAIAGTLLVLGLTGTVRFPALVTFSSGEYTREYHDADAEERSVAITQERCWGIPLVFRHCRIVHGHPLSGDARSP